MILGLPSVCLGQIWARLGSAQDMHAAVLGNTGIVLACVGSVLDQSWVVLNCFGLSGACLGYVYWTCFDLSPIV